MVTISQGQCRLGLNTQTICPLPLANVLAKFCLNNQKIFREMCKNVISDAKNGHHFQRSRSFEVKSRDKMPLINSNIPTTFCSNKHNIFGEKSKNVISYPKNGRHFPRSMLFAVKFVDKVPLTPSNVPIKFR